MKLFIKNMMLKEGTGDKEEIDTNEEDLKELENLEELDRLENQEE